MGLSSCALICYNNSKGRQQKKTVLANDVLQKVLNPVRCPAIPTQTYKHRGICMYVCKHVQLYLPSWASVLPSLLMSCTILDKSIQLRSIWKIQQYLQKLSCVQLKMASHYLMPLFLRTGILILVILELKLQQFKN